MKIKYLENGKVEIELNYKGEDITKEFDNEILLSKFISQM
jgi:hypothetical protein